MANLVAAFTSSGALPGRKRAAAATSSLVESPRKRWRSSSGAVTVKLWSWFAAWLRTFTADWRADLKVRIISLPGRRRSWALQLLGRPAPFERRPPRRWDRTCRGGAGGVEIGRAHV